MFNRKVALIASLLLTLSSACGFLDQELFVDDELLEEESFGSGGMSISGVGGGGYGSGRVCGCGGRIHVGHARGVWGLQKSDASNHDEALNPTNRMGPGDSNQDGFENPALTSPVEKVAGHASTRRAAALDHFAADGVSRKDP